MPIKKLLTYFRKLKFIGCLLLLNFSAQYTAAQSDSNALKLKINSIGFDYQLQLNHLDLSPQIWLLQWRKIQAAADLHMLYYFNNTDRKGKMAAGLGATVRYHFTQNLFSEIIYQNMNIPVRQMLDMSFYRAWKADFLIGVGYKQKVNNRCTAQIAALYTMNYKTYSAYESKYVVKAGAYWFLK